MISKFVQVGNKIEIESIKKTTGELGEVTRKTYRSELYDIESEDIIKIAMPMEQSKIVLLPVDAEYSLCFYTPNGLYQCLARVVERYKSNNLFVLSMELETDLQKYQRREYYRYSCTVPVFSRCLSEEEQKTMVWDETQKGIEGSTLDIGGGGVRYLVSEQMTAGEMVICYLELEIKNTVKEIQALGKILSVRPVKDSNLFEVRVQFEKISNAAREQIIQYIFEDERKRRKKSNGL